MTSRITEIQTLIADIDGLLSNKNNLLSRFISAQGQDARVVLEQVREFLVRLDGTEAQSGNSDHSYPRSPLLAQFADREQKTPLQYTEVSALLQPLQTELQMLLQERSNLVQEIRQLEQKRLHNYSVAQQMENQERMISEFLRVLMHRMEGKLSFDSGNDDSRSHSGEALPQTGSHTEHLNRLADDLDQRLVALDGTVNVVFEGLQRNIYTYHESLSQAIARMHSKGIQGEHLLVALIDNLTALLQHNKSVDKSRLDVQPENLPIPPSLSTQGEYQSGVDFVANRHRDDSLSAILETQEPKYLPVEPEQHPQVEENQEVEIASDRALPLEMVIEEQIEEPVEVPAVEEQAIATPELRLNNDDSVSDRVDRLYASLFGTETENTSTADIVSSPTPEATQDNLANPSTDSPTPTPEDIQEPKPTFDTTELTTINVSNLVSGDLHPHTHDNLDMWFERPGEGLSGNSHVHSAIPQEIIKKNQPIDTSKNTVAKANTDIENLPPVVELTTEPTTEDISLQNPQETISALSDLFPDTATEEPGIAEVDQDLDNAFLNNTAQSLISDTESGYLEKSLEDYVLASPAENLLAKTVDKEPTIPAISLNEENLQQLADDLDEFDGEFAPQQKHRDDREPASSIAKTPSLPQPEPVINDIPEISARNGELSPTDSMAVVNLTTNAITNDPKNNSLLSVFNPVNTPDITISTNDGVWYLGIDLGSTGISAALLNRSTTEVYPIYWSSEEQSDPNSPGSSFRLPAEVYIPTTATEKQTEPGTTNAAPEQLQNLFSAQLKPYLQIALPYKNQQQKWEPFLELNEYSTVPLVWVVRSLSKLLLTLKSDRTSTTPGLIACAVGIQQQKFHQLINNIAGVICNCPANSSEQYRFNLREALITGKIVQHPQQVFFIEDAIANLLAGLDGADGEQVKFPIADATPPDHYPLEGNTLIINIGASATEMGLIEVPNNLLDLAHNDFMLHGFAYAGKGIEQDIICQLLLPEKWRESRLTSPEPTKTISSDPWHWQPSIPGLEQMRWHSLRLTELKLPRSGEPDIPERIRLQQRLESSLLGKAVLDAAVALKLILQHQESFTLELADQRWTLQRRDLESQVFVPFVRRLNRELNKLLVARGIPTEAINQAILTGGVASITAVNRWLRQKLPNAKIIQDSYLGENGTPTCSRTAYGLALLPLHPQVLDIPRQQYTDYFLFTELLRILPDRAVSLNEITQLFEGRGINTRICQQRLLTFLEGELPSGLLPSTLDYHWLAPISQENYFYKQLAAAPLFEKQGSLTYCPNSQQIKLLLTYLDAIKASNQQSLEEPYTVNFVLGVPV